MEYINQFLHGDCLEVLQRIPDATADLILTSPPYADQRKNVYGGIHPDQYVEWFMPRAAEFRRVLKPTGSFILNIKERVVNGERHTYVLELILEMRRHLSHYFKGLPGFRETRLRLLTSPEADEIRAIIDEIREKWGDCRYDRSTGIYGI